MSKRNPYHWDGDQPEHVVRRETLLMDVLASIARGESTILLGARGMGKSVFLAQLAVELKALSNLDTLSFPCPPSTRTVAGAIGELAEAMVRRAERRRSAPSFARKLQEEARAEHLRELIDTYLAEFPTEVERLILLYDEFDGYAEPRELGLYFFNELEDVRKKLGGQLVVVAAGGLGLLALDTVFGSSFFTRKNERILEPFGIAEMEKLAEPFSARGVPLPTEIIDDIRLASGGNVLLATYGFQQLWSIATPSRRDVQGAYRNFQEHSSAILDSIWNAVFELDLSEIPFRTWRALQRGGGTLLRAELAALRRESKTKLSLSEKKILDMLRASGLVRMSASVWGAGVDPITVECIPSILALRPFDDEITGKGSLQEQLRHDLQSVLVRIHSMTPAFYRPADRTAKKEDAKMVPEGTFAAGLVLGLDPRGWMCDLEAMSGAGYPDIKARHSRFGEDKALVEVKIWPRNDYTKIHEQVTAYFTDGVRAFATVMISEKQSAGWEREYAQACLEGKVDSHVWHPLGPPLAGYFEARTGPHVVNHFLLQLPTRR